MLINDNFFSFPPHLSTSWENISALSLNTKGQITVHLTSGDTVILPVLDAAETKDIFSAHASYLEKQVLKDPLPKKERLALPSASELPIRIGFGSAMEGFPAALQHNPAQSEGPDLPAEMLSKITQISKILIPEELQDLPPAEPHCNCPHCQIVRAIVGEARILEALPKEVEGSEEEITEEDLNFQQWEILQTGDQLFAVTNKLDPSEKYNVFLGQPLGCTCGKVGCEHILVVLKS